MRVELGAIVLAACCLSTPARANGGAALGEAPLQTPASAIVGTGADAGVRIASDFRIRLDSGMARQSGALGGSARHDANLRRRFSSSMIDYYPVGEGFHLSLGGRRDNRGKAARVGSSFGNYLLYAPKSPLATTRGGGFKRFAPAMTAGYTATIDKGMTIGIEGGALMERGDPATRELTRFMRLGGRDQRFSSNGARVNPMAQVAFAYRF